MTRNTIRVTRAVLFLFPGMAAHAGLGKGRSGFSIGMRVVAGDAGQRAVGRLVALARRESDGREPDARRVLHFRLRRGILPVRRTVTFGAHRHLPRPPDRLFRRMAGALSVALFAVHAWPRRACCVAAEAALRVDVALRHAQRFVETVSRPRDVPWRQAEPPGVRVLADAVLHPLTVYLQQRRPRKMAGSEQPLDQELPPRPFSRDRYPVL